VSHLGPYAEQYLRGQQPSNILLHEVKNALAAYCHAAERLARALRMAPGPRRGPTNEYAMDVASIVKTVLGRAGIPLSDDEKGTLTQTISIAFDALGIAKGEPRQYAARVLAASK
jgi:hypothetical protein